MILLCRIGIHRWTCRWYGDPGNGERICGRCRGTWRQENGGPWRRT